MRASAIAFVVLAQAGHCAGLPDLPAPGSEQRLLDLSAHACGRSAGELVCRRPAPAAATLYGVPLLADVLVFRDGQLARSSAVFAEDRFDDVQQAAEAELGPGERDVELLKAGMGGTFPSRIQIWRRQRQVLFLEQYFERVVSSALTVMTVEEFERLMAAREARRVRGARDL